MDLLSDVLCSVRVSRAVFVRAVCSSPWALDSPDPKLLAPVVSSEERHVVLLHLLTEGKCILTCQAYPPLVMEAGDLILSPHAAPHAMRSEYGATSTSSILPVLFQGSPDTLPQVALGGGGKKACVFCGCLSCDQRFNPLFEELPTLLLVHGGRDDAPVEAIGPSGARPLAVPPSCGSWLSTILTLAIEEAKAARPGSTAILGRLAELIIVEILRDYVTRLPAGPHGWLAAVKDMHVGKAMGLLHANPSQRWTVAELARRAGISRSGLGERFTRLLGEPPKRYLAAWRTELAKRMLHDNPDLTVAEVAGRVGYATEAAFNRAFKRVAGRSPVGWRKTSLH